MKEGERLHQDQSCNNGNVIVLEKDDIKSSNCSALETSIVIAPVFDSNPDSRQHKKQ